MSPRCLTPAGHSNCIVVVIRGTAALLDGLRTRSILAVEYTPTAWRGRRRSEFGEKVDDLTRDATDISREKQLTVRVTTCCTAAPIYTEAKMTRPGAGSGTRAIHDHRQYRDFGSNSAPVCRARLSAH